MTYDLALTFSSVGSHEVTRCRFFRHSHSPFWAHSRSCIIATCDWPWPMATLTITPNKSAVHDMKVKTLTSSFEKISWHRKFIYKREQNFHKIWKDRLKQWPSVDMVKTWWYLSSPTVPFARSSSSCDGSAPGERMNRIGSVFCVSSLKRRIRFRLAVDNSLRPAQKTKSAIRSWTHWP